MFLYLLKFASGKSYVGQTQRGLKVRMQQHARSAESGSLLAVHCAWRKHGVPECELIGEYASAEELHVAEIAAIMERGTLSPSGYNLGLGGETAPSRHPEVAAKIAAKAKGRKPTLTAEDRARKADAMRQRMADPAYRDKIAQSWTPERRARMAEIARARRTGVRLTDEQKYALSLAKKNISDETRAKMSASAKARGTEHLRTPEVSRKIADATAASWENLELRERRIAAIRKVKNDPSKAMERSAKASASWRDPEIRAKRSAAIRAGHARRKLEEQGHD